MTHPPGTFSKFPGIVSKREPIPPEEIPWCEDCGASMEFCECNVALDDGLADWEYERKRDREMELEWTRMEKEKEGK